jgi:hypothetical protein
MVGAAIFALTHDQIYGNQPPTTFYRGIELLRAHYALMDMNKKHLCNCKEKKLWSILLLVVSKIMSVLLFINLTVKLIKLPYIVLHYKIIKVPYILPCVIVCSKKLAWDSIQD